MVIRIELATGIEIDADSVHISDAIFPTDSVENLARAYLWPIPPKDSLPYVIVPCKVIETGPSDFKLPSYRFMAIFDSIPTEAHLDSNSGPGQVPWDASWLTIIWLQNELWPLVSDENRRLISELDWPNLAKDGHW